VAGYTGTIGGTCAVDGTITLSPGDELSCTITNDDVQAQLTVTKIVTKLKISLMWTLLQPAANSRGVCSWH